MKIFVQAKPSAKKEKIEKIDDTHFTVYVKEPPIQGKANRAIIKAIANFFHTSVSDVSIVSGHFTRSKIIEINFGD